MFTEYEIMSKIARGKQVEKEEVLLLADLSFSDFETVSSFLPAVRNFPLLYARVQFCALCLRGEEQAQAEQAEIPATPPLQLP